MGDTTSLYLLEMYEIYRHNGNRSFIAGQWDSAKRATAWMIKNAQTLKSNESSYGLPYHLSTTYDHFGFSTHNTVAYSGPCARERARVAPSLASPRLTSCRPTPRFAHDDGRMDPLFWSS